MTPTEALQIAILDHLRGDQSVTGIVGVTGITDYKPADRDCVCFGPADVLYGEYHGVDPQEINIQLDCWVQSDGATLYSRRLAETVAMSLRKSTLTLEEHRLQSLTVERVRAMLDADRKTGHGIVHVLAKVDAVSG